MANFLQDIATRTRSFLQKGDSVDFSTVHHYLRTTQISARKAQTMIHDVPDVFNYLHESLVSDIPSNATKVDKELQVKYKRILSSTGWARSIKRPQPMGKFHVFEKTFGVAHKDIDWVIDNLSRYFPSTEKTVNFKDLTMAQAYILSYVSNINTTISWFQYLVYNYRLPKSSYPYKYQLAYMDDNEQIVEKTLIDGLEGSLRSKSPFRQGLDTMIKDGKNMQILVDDQSIDKFASKRDFPKTVEDQMRGFFNIPLFFGNVALSFQRQVDEYRETNIEWMNTRIAVISMDMQELDPQSDEYKRKEKILNNYTKEVAEFEEKLNKSKEDI